jgi:hypothetical protein
MSGLEGLEPPTLCFEVTQYKTLRAASGVSYEEARHLSRLNWTEVGLTEEI